jgi:rhomboid protease GluP
MCQACRGLIEASVKTCPLCGRDSVPAEPARAVEGSTGGHFVSRLLLTINIALFVLMALADMRSGRGAEAFFDSASTAVTIDFGSMYAALVVDGQWWRLVTPNFLHYGLIHLLFNSVALYQIGPQVEELYGPQKFIFLYLFTGIAAMAASFVFGIMTVGASGSIFGLIGLMAAYGYRLGGTFGRAITRQMLIWAGFGILLGFGIGANNVAHVAGLVAGGALAFAVTAEEPRTASAQRLWNLVAVACVLLITSSFMLVAMNYGSWQRSGDVIKLSDKIHEARDVLSQSFRWSGTTDRDPAEVGAALRSAAADIQRVPSIDEPSDSIKARLVDLLAHRAQTFDSVQLDPAGPTESKPRDDRELGLIFGEYKAWEKSVLVRHGLEYKTQPLSGGSSR